jgi:RNA polymerase sigma-70 factor (ECF subfamily)
VNEFASNVERHRRELLLHCYRTLGSLPDAEDAVQETLLRAWRYRDSLKEGAPLRPWLYRVATNACLDAIARDERRAVLAARAAADDGWTGEPDDVVWLGPIPNTVLEPTTPPARTPDDDADARNHRDRLSDGNPAPHTAAAGCLDTVRRAGLVRQGRCRPARPQRPSRKQCIAARAGQAPRASAVFRKPPWPANVDASAAERDLLKKYIEAANRRTFGLSNRSSVRTRPSAGRPTSAGPKAVTPCSGYGLKADLAPKDLVASVAL